MSARATAACLTEFIGGVGLADLPAPARERLALALADMAAVSVAGRPAPAARLAAEHAIALHPADDAVLLLDGRRAGVSGVAFANGVLANALDYDDGHRLTKGHPGAVIIPSMLAVAQHVDACAADLLVAIAIGYEVAIRAGIALHARDPAYHASGAWGAIGAAAGAARLLELDAPATEAALGLAEYHAPIALIMRSCADPQMTKDACAWGARTGVEAALLAGRGFTSVRPEMLDAELDDLGRRWRMDELYIKAYPCCRWSQGAIEAALEAAGRRPLDPADVARVRVHTFAAAGGLGRALPTTTEEAQYSLHWPVACALARGRFGVAEALGPFDDPAIASMFERIEIEVDGGLTARFPAQRLTAVQLELSDGSVRRAGPLQAPGEPDDPGLSALVAGKLALISPDDPALAIAAHDGVRACGVDGLLWILRNAETLMHDA